MSNFKPWQVISDLEMHSSRINKEQIIEAEAQNGNTEFFLGAKLALDSMITFGLKQIPEKTDEDGVGLDWDTFDLAVSSFINRSVTGNAARNTVSILMSNATKKQWNNWYRRILIKDLRCGVSEKTINKVVADKYPQYAIPVFGCQLAHDGTNHGTKVVGRKLIESKLDGVRVITIVYPGKRVDDGFVESRVEQFSRNGKELVNFPHIVEQLKAVAKIGGFNDTDAWVLDGEVMSSSFQDLMKQVHRKDNVQSNDAVLHLFDILPLEEFKQGKSKTTQINRSSYLEGWYNVYSTLMPNVELLGQELVDLDTEAGHNRFTEINDRAIANGYEGIMIKDPDALYECKRTASWLKLKPYLTCDLVVVAVEEGTGRNVGKLGALVCEGPDLDKFIRVNVGSGFTDEQRESIWVNKDKVIGQMIEVRADAVTKNQDSDTTYSLRFPRFERFRDDK